MQFVGYECLKCKNRGCKKEGSNMRCSLCGTNLDSENILFHAPDEKTARSMLVKAIAKSTSKSRGKIQRGLGTRRRVLNIVHCLVDLRRGRPVSKSKILEECVDAGIDSEKALHHLSLLLDSGEVIHTSEGYRPGTIEEVL